MGSPMDPTESIALLQRHRGLIHRIAWGYCPDAHAREDVVQEIAVQLWRAGGRYDGRVRESTWVARIAINVAISFHRREERHRRRQAAVDVAAIDAPALSAAATLEASEELGQLRRCIDEQGALDRALLLLHLEGRDHAAIAEALGISATNVGTKLWRIKGRLRAALASGATAGHDRPEPAGDGR